jgi:hypothetical protein
MSRKSSAQRKGKPAPAKGAGASARSNSKPLPKRGAALDPLRKLWYFTRIMAVAIVAFAILKALYEYHPIQRLENGLISATRQGGLRLEQIVLYDAASPAPVASVLLKECLWQGGQLQLDSCYHSNGKYPFNTAVPEILKAMEVTSLQPILRFDPHKAHRNLKDLPWIDRVVVSRRLPKTVAVQIKERVAVTYWEQTPGTLWLLDRQGRRIIQRRGTSDALPLFVLRGDDAPQQVRDLLALLERQPRIKSWVTAARWVNGRRWNLTLRNGVSIDLPETSAASALDRLAAPQTLHTLYHQGFQHIIFLPDGSMVVKPIVSKQGQARSAPPRKQNP